MFANIVNAAHLQVSDLTCVAYFATESIQRGGISHGSLHKELQSQEIAYTAADPGEVDSELRFLATVLTRK